jgi:hypothetical protein
MTSRKYKARLIYILLLFSAASSADEFRKFTNTQGKEIDGQIIDYLNEGKVSIKMRNGTIHKDVDVSFFSTSDRAYFKEWKREQLLSKEDANLTSETRLSIFVKKSRDNDLNDKGDPDNRVVEYEPKITIDNEEKDYSFKNVKGTLVFIGQSVLNNKEFHILYREDFVVSLPANRRVHWEGKSFTNVYDDYAKNGSAFGAVYEGYLILLRDKGGAPKIIKASKSSWRDHYQRILKVSLNKGHSRDFSQSFPKTVH